MKKSISKRAALRNFFSSKKGVVFTFVSIFILTLCLSPNVVVAAELGQLPQSLLNETIKVEAKKRYDARQISQTMLGLEGAAQLRKSITPTQYVGLFALVGTCSPSLAAAAAGQPFTMYLWLQAASCGTLVGGITTHMFLVIKKKWIAILAKLAGCG